MPFAIYFFFIFAVIFVITQLIAFGAIDRLPKFISKHGLPAYAKESPGAYYCGVTAGTSALLGLISFKKIFFW